MTEMRPGDEFQSIATDADFDIPLDTLILAISQHALLDFLEGEAIALNDRGYIKVDPQTFETSVPGVYAGGDVANDGPATIVKAAAAGKAIANSILGIQYGTGHPFPGNRVSGTDIGGDAAATQPRESARPGAADYCCRAAELHRGHAHLFCRAGTYARQRAASTATPTAASASACARTLHYSPMTTDQRAQHYQVAVLADLCNECGNCTTFCPTSGAPYRDKPRLYLNREDFEAQQDNAFMIFHDSDRWAIEARCEGHEAP